MSDSKNNTHKKAKTQAEAWQMQELFADRPKGWIQWKGTEACMDLQCVCGCGWHIDAGFAYFVKCPDCGRVYMCNGHIELIEIEEHKGLSSVVEFRADIYDDDIRRMMERGNDE